jgi:hypothetical protein
MKFASVAKSALPGLALTMLLGLALTTITASSAFASTKGNLELSNPVTVAGTTLKPGDYKVEWEGAGPNVQVSILQGKQVVAKVPARIVALHDPSPNNAAVTQPGNGATSSLAGIRFQGKTVSLELDDASSSMQAGSSK